jgi:hypothetical protein
MAPAAPPLRRGAAGQAQVGLVDQRRGVERLAGLLPRQPLGRQPAQLVIHQRQQLAGGGRVTLLGGAQDPAGIAHERRL